MTPLDFLINSLSYFGLITIAMIPVGMVNPRIMLHSYPKEIQAIVPPKTRRERMLTPIFATPILLVMIGYPAVMALLYETSFVSSFLLIWSMMLAFNVYDLLVLDWLMFCYITPKFIVIKGTEGNAAYKNYRFHFIGFLKGIFITAIISAIVAGLLSLI